MNIQGKDQEDLPEGTSPGEEWVFIGSGNIEPETHKGPVCPEAWTKRNHGRILVKHKESGEWYGYDHLGEMDFSLAPANWQRYAETEYIHALTGEYPNSPTEVNIFDEAGNIKWDEVFNHLNPYQKPRKELFPNGTSGMDEQQIIDDIRKNHSFILAGAANPLELPEVIDMGLRPICSTINKTIWGRSHDGCIGDTEGMHPYLRFMLDTRNPSSQRFIKEIEQFVEEYKSTEDGAQIGIEFDTEDFVAEGSQPVVICYSIKLKKHPEEKEEKIRTATLFFNKLNDRIKDIPQD